MAGSMQQSNFTHLRAHDEQLVRLGLLAERYFAEDPNTCLLKLRQLGHWGTGDLELSLTTQADLDGAKPMILMSYEGRGAVAVPETPTGPGS